MDQITLEFDNRLSDHLAADRLDYRTTLLWKIDKVVAVGLACFGVYSVASAGLQWWTAIWFALAVSEWFNLLSPRPLQIRWMFKRNPKFKEAYRLTFTEEGIHFQTASIDSHIAWTHYTRVVEGKEVILLVYGARMYTVIPIRAHSLLANSNADLLILRGGRWAWDGGRRYRPARWVTNRTGTSATSDGPCDGVRWVKEPGIHCFGPLRQSHTLAESHRSYRLRCGPEHSDLSGRVQWRL